MRFSIVGAAAACAFVTAGPALAQQASTTGGGVVSVSAPAEGRAAAGPDFARAKPMTLPAPRGATAAPTSAGKAATPTFPGAPGFSPGSLGSGAPTPVRVAPAAPLAPEGGVTPQSGAASQAGAVAPRSFGTSQQPFTTAQAAALGNNTTLYWPFRATGRLFFTRNGASYVCSASMIKRGVVLTAAHCVTDYGSKKAFSDITFIPAYDNGAAPFGVWKAQSVHVAAAYWNGNDACAVAGVVCQNDVAVIGLAPQNNAYAGDRTGYYAVGWNGYSYNASGQAQITQLGYPVALDNGAVQERTDSMGYVASASASNTIIGSLQTGGSSGGPWLVNFGRAPTITGQGVTFGSAAASNTVVGVTSWGYVDQSIKQQGASPFTSNNIVQLLNAVCAAAPARCQ